MDIAPQFIIRYFSIYLENNEIFIDGYAAFTETNWNKIV
jgi:hypothetical protein